MKKSMIALTLASAVGLSVAQTTPPPTALNVHTGQQSLILNAFTTGPAPFGLASFSVPPDLLTPSAGDIPADTAYAFALIDNPSLIPGIDQDIPGFDLVLLINLTPVALDGVGFGFGSVFAELTDFNGGAPIANGDLPAGGLYLTLVSEQDTRDITLTLDRPDGRAQSFTFAQSELLDIAPARVAFVPIPASGGAGVLAVAGLLASRRRR